MSDSLRNAEIPTEQALVPFYDREIIAVRLPDGRIAATLASMCEVLQLLTRGQARRIRADPIVADHLIPARIETAGGPQNLDVLVAWAIPRWLSGIRLGMVALEKRPVIEAFQREAADILYRHFAQRQLVLPSGGVSVPAVPDAASTAPAAIASQVAALAEQIDTLTSVVAFLREHMEAVLEASGQVSGFSLRLDQAIGLLESLAERQETVQEATKARLTETQAQLAALTSARSA